MTNVRSILSYLKSQHESMIQYLESLVILESPSGDPEAQQTIFMMLKRSFEVLDYHVVVVPGRKTGGYFYARPANKIKGADFQLLVGHCDTVWQLHTLDKMPFVREESKVRGPGVYDMKAGLTQILFALKTIREMDLQWDLMPVILINSDEEIGSRESTPIIKRLAKLARRALVLEPPLGIEGKLKTARKGLGRFEIRIIGKPAHAGLDPGGGASAIMELSHQIQRIFALNDPAKGISVNVGLIEGGVSANVIAPESSAVIDVRVSTVEDGEHISKVIHALEVVNPETKIIVKGGIGRPPMEPTERNQKLWDRARLLGTKIGLKLEEATAGGGSDGNTTSQYTATLDGLGTTGDGAHALHEYIFENKIRERTALLTLL
ncbi:MAG: M20 family metallopeptidase, partial [Bacteroidia bacterium]|nr:M20 family metallopeptidase [Bacteroidia bacterium]